MERTHPLHHLEAILAVGIGGFAGSNLRYFVELLLPSSLLATAVVNVLGSLALGFFLYENLYGRGLSRPSRTILATGFLASFTTYSTFVLDIVTTAPVWAFIYVIGSYGLGFGAAIIGREGARWVTETIPAATEANQ